MRNKFMILSYIYNVVRFQKWRLLFFVVLFIFGLKLTKIITFRPAVDQLLEIHNCPVCYGVSACSYIHNVDITPHDSFSAFFYFFGVKNVFFGTLGKSKVVLKKLAHSSELDDFDWMVCKNKNFSHLCIKTTNKGGEYLIDFYELIKSEVTLDFVKDNFSRLRLCPTTRHLSNLLKYVYRNNKNIDLKTLNINIWVLAVINPEPLLLQILPADEGWPVPKYLGACGRIVIEEYVGLPLTTFYHESWLVRAQIASSLLNAAHIFTFKSDDFGFYLTDISADNIAVDSHNIARFIDLENVIVVDKHSLPEERPTRWEQLQENTENFHCPDCLVFSPADICDHEISDHNYYAICQLLLALHVNDGLLPGGLLHNVPADILEKYPTIQYLVQQCAIPEAPNTRISAGIQLKQLLDTILQDQQ